MGGLKDRKGLLKGGWSKWKLLDNCNGNFRRGGEGGSGDFWEWEGCCYLSDEEIGIRGGEK